MYFVVDLIWTEIIEHEQSERFPHLNTVSTVKKKLIILKLFDLKHESWNKDVGFNFMMVLLNYYTSVRGEV